MLLLSPAVDAAADGLFRRLMSGHGDPTAYSPRHLVKEPIAPTMLVQGEKDTVTPSTRARQFCGEVVMHGGVCELHEYAGVGHLLTRNVDGNLNLNIEPDPAAAAASHEAEAAFLRKLWP
jgi:dipeptidyl aminopeptidase/acylaminoacyl peptidase